MNKIIITGRLVADPELKSTNNGTEVCNFAVAVDRRVKKGEEKIADFINCTAWSKSAAFIAQYFHKGDGITVDGRMESRQWTDKENNKRTSWGVTCDNVEFALGKGNSSASSSTANASPYVTPQTAEFTPMTDESDLPF